LGEIRDSSVAESETDPLIRFADLSPARRGTASLNEAITRPPNLLLTCSPALAEGVLLS
jgi:hypothetical protein